MALLVGNALAGVVCQSRCAVQHLFNHVLSHKVKIQERNPLYIGALSVIPQPVLASPFVRLYRDGQTIRT